MSRVAAGILSIKHCHIFIQKKNSKLCDKEYDDIDKPNAYFISLVATSSKGLPEKENFLYDVATEMELQGFRVRFLSSNDIKKFYEKHHPGFEEEKVDIYKMTNFFIKMHPGSSFFLDELPFITSDESKLLR